MARIKKAPLSPVFNEVQQASVAAGENNDCFPKAVAILTELPYETVTEAFSEAGRVSNQATPWAVARVAIEALGFKLERIANFERDMIASYPGIAKTLKNVTTHHPARYKKCWEGQSVLLHTNRHVSAVKDGKMHDWAINRSLHVIGTYRIVAK